MFSSLFHLELKPNAFLLNLVELPNLEKKTIAKKVYLRDL